MQRLSDGPLRNRAAQQPAAATVQRLPCSALLSPSEVMRKICSPARNSVKVKEFAEKRRDNPSRGGAGVDGRRQPEPRKTVFLLKLSLCGLTTSVVFSSGRTLQPVCMRAYQAFICINYCHSGAGAAAICTHADAEPQSKSEATLS